MESLVTQQDTEELIAVPLLCGKCREHKLPTEFYKNRATPTGHDGYCKLCRLDADRKYRSSVYENPEKHEKRKASQKAYRDTVRDDRRIAASVKLGHDVDLG